MRPSRGSGECRATTTGRPAPPRAYLERWRIFLRLRWRRRVRFFFHFHLIFECAFFQGLDLWPPPRRRSTRWRVDSASGGEGVSGDGGKGGGLLHILFKIQLALPGPETEFERTCSQTTGA